MQKNYTSNSKSFTSSISIWLIPFLSFITSLQVYALQNIIGYTAPSLAAFSTIDWSTVASQQYPVYEAQGQVVKGKLYTFGGFDSQKTTTNWTPTDRAYMYDPVLNRWSSIAPMPPMNGTNNGGVTHAGFTTDGTDIYFAGGYTSNSTGTGQILGTKEVWKYIVAENRYTRLPEAPKTIASGQLQYLNGKLHYVAGFGNTSLTLDVGTHYVLDLNNLGAGWKTLAPLPNPRNHLGSAVYAGKIYMIGGQRGNDHTSVPQKDVHVYDPSTNSWAKLADMPVPNGTTGRAHISSSVIVVGERIIVIAGETSHNVRTNMVSAYSPATNTWQNLNSFPISVSGGVAANLGGNIYYTGGPNIKTTYKGTPRTTNVQKVVSFTLFNADTKQEIQTLTSGSILNLSALPTKNLNIRANTSPATVGSVIFALSGIQSKSVTESVAPYDLMGDNGAWTPAVGNYTLKATPYAATKGTGTVGTSLTVNFSVINQATDPLVSNISVSSGKSYTSASLAAGVKHYTDRTYQVMSVPSSLTGASLIQTANDDKKYTGSTQVSFSLSQSATVYIAYDPRATALPSWLSGWQKLTDRIGVNDPAISHMSLYSKSFAAGTVSLGGNLQSPAAGAQNNYFIIVKAQQAVIASTINYSTSTSAYVRDGNNFEMTVYPNPTSGDKIYVEVRNLGEKEAFTLTLHDVIGRVFSFDTLIADEQGTSTLELFIKKSMNSGLYFIKVQTATASKQSKLIIQ